MAFFPTQELAFEPLLQPIELGPHAAAASTSTPTSSARLSAYPTPSPPRSLPTGLITNHYFLGSTSRRSRLGDGSLPLSLSQLQSSWPPAEPARLRDAPPTPDEVERRPSRYTAFTAAKASDTVPDASVCPPLIAVSRFVPNRTAIGSSSNRASTQRITLLLTHGAGFHKELFEPMIEHVVELLRAGGNHSIELEEAWCIDMPGHGDSRAVNGSGPWLIDGKDYMRDVLTFVALYLPSLRSEANEHMPTLLKPDVDAIKLLSNAHNGPRDAPLALSTRPNLVGIGHSIGGETMVGLAMHAPRLFSSIAVIEPIILDAATQAFGTRLPLARFALKKEWRWDNVEEAQKHFLAHPVYGQYRFDVREKFLAHGVTASSFSATRRAEKAVMLKASPYTEAIAYLDHQTVVSLAPRGAFFPPIPSLWITGSRPLMYSAKEAPPLETVHRLAQRFRGMQVEVLQGGHNLPYDDPASVAKAICRFITAFTGTASSASHL
ncbi:alpha/beta-hydrolase [Ceraceosorus guamensis]|uniref:Alpha/beta-hydrolase n=1 Tax=Ceraceosorus guamensis TaxID=1522189 RepID=A0A316VSX6_9BASI|nr:alpha/beta-hydrolase [Ceraceosorus guamensis]PWN39311.1 alpha/beta-hydrolase [Ceraceosorus guamensis]